ncbi:hypothetical protein Lche_0648 [Legionella cherrii]|uniref:Uncharacterized protein n=1 Tax=Legionella cherrii TaxID=28084 RepID=A0A0W0SG10_9GAMM|nr:hypothetical protein [Legionella cherrii]KTC82384.1 hypothetical protein Lche_0648 [Legionella cherrii]
MTSVNPVVYSQINLQAWQKELPSIELQISETAQLIEKQRHLLKPYQEELRALNARISWKKYQIMQSKGPILNFMYQTDHDSPETLRFRSELELLQSESDVLEGQMKPYEEEMSKAQLALRDLSSRQAWLKEHIPAAQLFLKMLQENPQASVQALVDKIWQAFIDYEDTHMTGLSPQVRISLIAARYGLNILVSEIEGFDDHYTKVIQRNNYLRLCGFLWDMYFKIKQEDKDPAFEKILASLIESTHVTLHDDLPYPISTCSSAESWFAVNKHEKPEYFAIQERNLPHVEEEIFNNGLFFIRKNPPARPTSIQKHIIRAVNLIEAEVKIKKQKKEEIDYHFYARVIWILNDVFEGRADHKTVNRLGAIAEYASRNNSVGKHVLGSLLVVFGALLIGASIAGFITTFGSSSILSAWGFSLGLSLLETEFVLGLASSLTAITGIGLTFFAGPDAIKSGTDFSQELIKINQGIEQGDEPSSNCGAVFN